MLNQLLMQADGAQAQGDFTKAIFIYERAIQIASASAPGARRAR